MKKLFRLLISSLIAAVIVLPLMSVICSVTFYPRSLLASTTTKLLFGSDTAITITLTSLANATRQQSVCIDNTTNLYLDALVSIKNFKTGASGTVTTGYFEVFAGGSQDAGTTWTDNATASAGCTTDTTFTLVNAPALGVFNATANATTYTAGPMSVAKAFNGVLPQKWFIVIGNQTGHALDTSAGGTVTYQGVYAQTL